MAEGPLTGIRVLDLTSVVFGPLATQILGDQGADVIKIEGPEGDTTRATGPSRSADMSAVFMGLNRSKRSLVLDLKEPEAKDALWRLIDGADVLVHSIRPQKIAKLGFGPDAVARRNPRIVYAALHGYGIDGPYAGQPAYDDVIQGQSGVVALNGMLGGEPRYAPMIMGDKTCGLVASQAITAALLARERTGKGGFVEIPMFETMTAYTLAEHIFGAGFVPTMGQIGYNRVLAPWRRPYKTRDGHLCMLAYTDTQWRRFWTLVDRHDLVEDQRFTTMKARSVNIAELYRIAGDCLTGDNTAVWLKKLGEAEIPCGPINSLDDLLADEHLNAVGLFREVEHPTEGRLRIVGSPVRFGEAPLPVERMQPHLGEHSREVLAEVGLSETEIDRMLESGATAIAKSHNREG